MTGPTQHPAANSTARKRNTPDTDPARDLATIRDGIRNAIAYAEKRDGRVPVGMLRALLGGGGR